MVCNKRQLKPTTPTKSKGDGKERSWGSTKKVTRFRRDVEIQLRSVQSTTVDVTKDRPRLRR